MSITPKDLKRTRELLKHGDFKRIALKMNVSRAWVSRVLNDTSLAEKHINIIQASLDQIEENKSTSIVPEVKERIKQLTR